MKSSNVLSSQTRSLRQNMYSGITYFSTWKRSSLHKKKRGGKRSNLSAADLNTWHYLLLKKNDINVFKGLQIL